ncbi:hypothetical protein NSERUTF1_4292 [Nocardia seriolae]|nr:hypothetical protein NSERUTF1_4292 [Nocardia seriolae]
MAAGQLGHGKTPCVRGIGASVPGAVRNPLCAAQARSRGDRRGVSRY